MFMTFGFGGMIVVMYLMVFSRMVMVFLSMIMTIMAMTFMAMTFVAMTFVVVTFVIMAFMSMRSFCSMIMTFVAVIVTIVFSLALMLVDAFAGLLTFSPWLSEAVSFFSVSTRYMEFTKGLISYDNVFFFLSLQVLFLFLTTRTLDAKRWN